MCYVPNSLELGYSGATKLPLGIYSSYSARYVGKAKIDASVALQYNFDKNGFHHLNLQVSKWNLYFKKSNLYDFIAYSYQDRIVDIADTKFIFQNHQIKYGLNLQTNIGVGLGLDYLTQDYKQIGGHLYAFKWFSKPKIGATITTSVFRNQINYKAETVKSFHFSHNSPIDRISAGLAYEDFVGYRDLYFSVRILLK